MKLGFTEGSEILKKVIKAVTKKKVLMKKKTKMKSVSPMMSKKTKIVGLMMKKMTPRIQGQRQLIKRKIVS